MDTLTARLTSPDLQPQILQNGPTGDADPPGRSLDSPSEGRAAEANANPHEPRETNGTPGESPGLLPAARTEPGEIEETPGRSPDSLPEGKGRDPIGDLGESFGLLSIERAKSDSISSGAHKNGKNRRKKHKQRQRGGKNPRPNATGTSHCRSCASAPSPAAPAGVREEHYSRNARSARNLGPRCCHCALPL